MGLIQNIRFLFTHGKKAWIKQHLNDQFVKKAAQLNFRSRAVFKLQEIELKYKILGQRIIDLGSAPGSWSQYALRYKLNQKDQKSNTLQNNKQQPAINRTKVVAVDLLDMKQIEGVDFYKCDARNKNLHQMFRSKYGSFDSIISDMAPNFSGVAFETHEQILALNKMCVQLCLQLSHSNCSLVMKTTQGQFSKHFFQFLEIIFEKAYRVKPKASRPQSKQFYFVCKKFNPRYFKQPSNGHSQKQKIINKKFVKFLQTEFDTILFNTFQPTTKKKLKQIIDQKLNES